MTSLALAMQDQGWSVSGCDTGQSFITDAILDSRSINVVSPISSPTPSGVDLLIYSGAYTPPASSVKTLSLAQALAEFVASRRVIAVAGVGGKTTTSAMLAVLMRQADIDAGYYVGTGSIAGLSAPGACGSSPWYIVEADEYAVSKTDKRAKMNLLTPEIVVTTNILHDHPDIYQSESETLSAFTELISRIKSGGIWVYNEDDPLTQKILAKNPKCKLIPYSARQPALNLQVFGGQNQLDAKAAVLAAEAAGISPSAAKRGIHSYRGCGRRQEFHGELAGRLLYDDYGHHPHEIEATLKAFKTQFPKRRLLLVFESHTYTRTESLLEEFAAALALADQTFIMPIFESARERGQSHSVTPASFAAMIQGALALTWDNAALEVWHNSHEGDIILTMGAGFVYKLHQEFKNLAKEAGDA